MGTKFPKKLLLLLVGVTLLIVLVGKQIMSVANNVSMDSLLNSQASLHLLGTQEEKTRICHYVGSKKKNYEFIEVGPAAAAEHKVHHNDIINVKSEADCPSKPLDATAIVTTTPEDGGKTPVPTTRQDATSTPNQPPTEEPSQLPPTSIVVTSYPTDTSFPGLTKTPENDPTSFATQMTNIPATQLSEEAEVPIGKSTQAGPATEKTKEARLNPTEIASQPTPNQSEEQIIDLRLTLHETEAQLNAAKQQGAELNQRLHEAKEKLEKAQLELSKAKGDKDLLQQQFAELQKEFNTLQLEKAVNDQHVKDLENMVSILRVAIDTSDAAEAQAYWTKEAAIIALVLGGLAIICSTIVTIWGEDIRAYFKNRSKRDVQDSSEQSPAD